VDVQSAGEMLGLPKHSMRFTEKVTMREFGALSRLTDKISAHLRSRLNSSAPVDTLSENEISVDNGRVAVKITPLPKSDTAKEVSVTWGMEVNSYYSFKRNVS
jgi:hypothetical protein